MVGRRIELLLNFEYMQSNKHFKYNLAITVVFFSINEWSHIKNLPEMLISILFNKMHYVNGVFK